MKKILGLIIGVFFLFSAPSSRVHAAATISPDAWIVQGNSAKVNATARWGNTVYLGGSFDYIGPPTGSMGAFLTTSPSLLPGLPKVNGTIYSIIPDGSGGWYIGGVFTQVGGVSRNNVAHILSDNTVDLVWNPNATGGVVPVRTMVIGSSTTIYVGGDYSNIGGQAKNRLARLNRTTGASDSWNPNATGAGVNALVINGSNIYVGGSFSNIGTKARTNLAALSTGSKATATTWAPNPDQFVSTLLVDAGNLYVGGGFNTVVGGTRHRIASYNISSGALNTWHPGGVGADNTVHTFAVSGGQIYIGGGFTMMGGQQRFGLAAVNTGDGLVTAWDPVVDGPIYTNGVFSLVISGNYVYVGGGLRNVGGIERRFMAAIDKNSGLLVSDWAPNAANTVHVLSLSGTTIAVGGSFTSIGGEKRDNLAALDAASGTANSWNPDANGEVRALAVSSNGATVYAGGDFLTIGTQTKNRIAAIDTISGVATSWDANADASVFALAIDGQSIYAGGLFTNIGGASRPRVAALDSVTGQATNWIPPVPNGAVRAVATKGINVYIGGDFSVVGQTRYHVASINASTGILNSWNPNVDNNVTSLAVGDDGNTVYVGGYFNNIGAQSRTRIGAIDAATGLATLWRPNADSTVHTLAVAGSSVYAGGEFTFIGGQLRSRLAALDVDKDLNMASSSWNPNVQGSGTPIVYTLDVSGTTVYAGGAFDTVSSEAHRGFAILQNTEPYIAVNKNTWETNGTISAVQRASDLAYIGGAFSYVGPRTGGFAVMSSGAPATLTTGMPVVDGRVMSIVPDGSGGWYIGGHFNVVGGLARTNIAHILANKTVDPAWIPNANNFVEDMALSADGLTLYVGGLFTSIGGQTRNYVAALNASSGVALTTWNAINTNGFVNVLAVDGSVLYVGGEFTTTGGANRNKIAALDASNGVATSWDPAINSGVGGTVYSITTSGSTVYLGGTFNTVAGQPRVSIAAVTNGATASATIFNPGTNGVVYDLQVHSNGTVYAGGQFSTAGSNIQPRNNIAAFDPTSSEATPWDPNANNLVYELKLSGDILYVGGGFSTVGVGGSLRSRNSAASFDISSAVATDWDPNANSDAATTVDSFAMNGAVIGLGGSFTRIGGVSRNNIAAINLSSGAATAWNPNANNPVTTLAIIPNSSVIYAGGSFQNIGGQSRRYLAALDTTTGIATGWDPNPDNLILTLAVSPNGDTIYAGGMFETIGFVPQTRRRIAALDNSVGNPTSWNPNVADMNAVVHTIALTPSGLTTYIGGNFVAVHGLARDNVAAIPTGGDGTPNDWNPLADNVVRTLVYAFLDQDNFVVYAGGDFTNIGGAQRYQIAALDALGTGQVKVWQASTNNSGSVRTLSLSQDNSVLYAGGDFATMNALARNHLAAIPTSGNGTPNSWNPYADQQVRSLAVSDSGASIFAGGTFTTMAGVPRKGFAVIQ